MPKVKSDRTSKTKSEATPTVKTDILMSIKQEHMNNIVSRKKNHEFRKYLISENIERIWFYVSSPDQHLRYAAVISKGKPIGEIEDEEGLGNADFNKGLKESKFAYEIHHLYRINSPLKHTELKSDYGVSPPQRYIYMRGKLFTDVVWEEQEKLF
ncbi:hypothetical protein M422DRAFT_32862 [Sphaerobolus stellatus SS14]|uniref:Unplaced genomic scaffold SPHSTscaffold_80, whole genome shotgun sequence n=1 Tax=Sphaerobolus stellatus (strain SS14) TaxID=990650 RepID=A0A0C9U7N7_SPHS4|nr:hypothetical protein M422DRAFT_32862 [Sphaerobolus stellatus SS14]